MEVTRPTEHEVLTLWSSKGKVCQPVAEMIVVYVQELEIQPKCLYLVQESTLGWAAPLLPEEQTPGAQTLDHQVV